jgi:hypothetical protein
MARGTKMIKKQLRLEYDSTSFDYYQNLLDNNTLIQYDGEDAYVTGLEKIIHNGITHHFIITFTLPNVNEEKKEKDYKIIIIFGLLIVLSTILFLYFN